MRQLSVPPTATGTPLRYLVCVVISARAEKQARIGKTWRVVAVVQNAYTVSNRPVPFDPGHAVH
jgi:hypothetical protein